MTPYRSCTSTLSITHIIGRAGVAIITRITLKDGTDGTLIVDAYVFRACVAVFTLGINGTCRGSGRGCCRNTRWEIKVGYGLGDVPNLLGLFVSPTPCRSLGSFAAQPLTLTIEHPIGWVSRGEELLTGTATAWHVIALASATTVSKDGTVVGIGLTETKTRVSSTTAATRTLCKMPLRFARTPCRSIVCLLQVSP